MTTTYDAHANLAFATVAGGTAIGSADAGGTLVLNTGQGAYMPATAPFNVVVWPADQPPAPTNTEIARVSVLAGDTITLGTRAVEGPGAARSDIAVGWNVAAGFTVAQLVTIETAVAALEAAMATANTNIATNATAIATANTNIATNTTQLGTLYPTHDLNGARHTDALKATTVVRESVRRMLTSSAALTAPVSGVMRVSAVPYVAGDVATNIAFAIGSTAYAAGTGTTHLWVALYDGTGALLAYALDDTTTKAIAVQTQYAAQLVRNAAAGTITNWTIGASGLYYHAIMIAGGTGPTMPTWHGCAVSSGVMALAPQLSGTTGAGLTTTPPASFVPSALTIANNAYPYTYST